MFVIIMTHPLHSPEVIGPFDSNDSALDHIENNITLEDEWDADVAKVENPYED